VIDQAQAVERARARAAEKGWAFVEPLRVVVRRSWSGAVTRYEIETNAGKLGSKARFQVDAESGDVVSEGYIPR
jgi:hypothetical protein